MGFDKTRGLEYFYEPYYYNGDVSFGLADERTAIINSDTLNERFEYSIDNSDKNFRIITLGDSWTYGLHVYTEHNWTERLEDFFEASCNPRVEVINLGVSGYDTRYELERFKKRGIKYNPDLVLWMVTDMKRIMEELIPEHDKRAKEEGWSDKIFKEVKDNVVNKMGLENVYKYQLNSLRSIDEVFKGKLVIVAESVLLSDEEKKLLADFAREGNSRFYFEPSSPYKDYFNLVIQGDGHPNELGHKLIAEDVFKYLTDSRLAPCN